MDYGRVKIKLLTVDLIRRHGRVIIMTDPAVAKILVEANCAVYVEEEIKKVIEKPPENKMIGSSPVTKSEPMKIFPKSVIPD